MRKRFAVLAVVALLLGSAAGAASITLTPFSVKGVTVSKTIRVDAEYATRHGKPVAAPFRIAVPETDRFDNYYDPKLSGAGDTTLLKIAFATKKRQVIEILRLVPVQIGMGAPELRVKRAARLLKEQAFPAAAKGYANPELLGIVHSKINGSDAAVAVGQFTDPSSGPLLCRLVLVLNPKAAHSLLAFSLVNPRLSAASAPNLLHKAGISYKVVESISWL